jgi:hypothetical protein
MGLTSIRHTESTLARLSPLEITVTVIPESGRRGFHPHSSESSTVTISNFGW